MFKVGDFVYFTEFSKYEEIDDKYGYGIILEIKDLPKSFEEGTERFAVIQVKYFEDGIQKTIRSENNANQMD